MKLRNIPHLIGQGFISFWRNRAMSTAAILVLICCMLVLGSFYIIIDNLNNFLDEQSEDLKTVNAYVYTGVTVLPEDGDTAEGSADSEDSLYTEDSLLNEESLGTEDSLLSEDSFDAEDSLLSEESLYTEDSLEDESSIYTDNSNVPTPAPTNQIGITESLEDESLEEESSEEESAEVQENKPEGTGNADINEIIAKLDKLCKDPNSGITGYEHISKAEALEEMKKQEGLEAILSEFNDKNNPLPERFRIFFDEFDSAPKVMRALEEVFTRDMQCEIESETEIYKTVTDLSTTMTMVGAWLMIILLLIAILIIVNTVKLTVFARRKDIAIMRYIGATRAFVTSPFIVEGIIIGLISTIISVGLQYYLYTSIFADIFKEYSAISIVPVTEYMYIIPVAFLILGLFAGIVASSVSVKKHLDV